MDQQKTGERVEIIRNVGTRDAAIFLVTESASCGSGRLIPYWLTFSLPNTTHSQFSHKDHFLRKDMILTYIATTLVKAISTEG